MKVNVYTYEKVITDIDAAPGAIKHTIDLTEDEEYFVITVLQDYKEVLDLLEERVVKAAARKVS